MSDNMTGKYRVKCGRLLITYSRFVNTLVHFFWRLCLYRLGNSLLFILKNTWCFLCRSSTRQFLLLYHTLWHKIWPTRCAENLKSALFHLTVLNHLLRRILTFNYWWWWLSNALICFWSPLKTFLLTWSLILISTIDCRLGKCDLKCNCRRKFWAAATLCYKFKLFVNAGSKQIIDIITRCDGMLLRLLNSKRKISRGCHWLEAANASSSVASWCNRFP